MVPWEVLVLRVVSSVGAVPVYEAGAHTCHLGAWTAPNPLSRLARAEQENEALRRHPRLYAEERNQ